MSAPLRFIYTILKSIYSFIRYSISAVKDFLFSEEEAQDEPLPDTVQKIAADPRALLPHLDAIRRHIFRSLIFLAITTSISFTFVNRILDFLAKPLPQGLESVQAIEVTEPISVLMRISLLVGFALALPYVTLEIVFFIGPGLQRRTRLFLVFVAVPASTILFVLGMAFAFYVMLPAAIPFLLGVLEFETNIRASSYVKFVTGVMFWIGVTFQLPLVIYIIARLGIIKAGTLARQWRLAIVLIAVVAAAITPTVDPVNMTIVMAPLTLLYFLSVGLAFLAQRGHSKIETAT